MCCVKGLAPEPTGSSDPTSPNCDQHNQHTHILKSSLLEMWPFISSIGFKYQIEEMYEQAWMYEYLCALCTHAAAALWFSDFSAPRIWPEPEPDTSQSHVLEHFLFKSWQRREEGTSSRADYRECHQAERSAANQRPVLGSGDLSEASSVGCQIITLS